jgi:hypothetical protein
MQNGSIVVLEWWVCDDFSFPFVKNCVTFDLAFMMKTKDGNGV